MRKHLLIAGLVAAALVVVVTGGYFVVRFLQAPDFSSLVPKDQLAAAEDVVEHIRNRQFPQMEGPADPAALDAMAAMFPRGKASRIRVVSLHAAYANAQSTVAMELDYDFPGGDMMDVKIETVTTGGGRVVRGVQFTKIPVKGGASERGVGRFSAQSDDD